MQRRLLPVLLAALAAVVVTLVLDPRGGDGGSATGGGTRTRARVTRVVDGDTVAVSIDGAGDEERSVRLLGIDTPETHRPGTPIECGGPEATANMERLAPPGTRVTLESDPSQDRVDRYGR